VASAANEEGSAPQPNAMSYEACRLDRTKGHHGSKLGMPHRFLQRLVSNQRAVFFFRAAVCPAVPKKKTPLRRKKSYAKTAAMGGCRVWLSPRVAVATPWRKQNKQQNKT